MKTLFFISLLLLNSTLFSQESSPRLRVHKIAQLNSTNSNQSDVQAEIEFGRGLASQILGKHKLVENFELQNYVNHLGAGLANQIGRPELTFYFAIIDSKDVNAYACPGGYIFLTQGLIEILANEAELVGVLAHEINHVNDRHVIKKLKIKGKDNNPIASLGALIGGATSAMRLTIKTLSDEAMNLLFNQGVMESEELESDLIALAALNASAYDVESYKSLLLKIKESLNSNKAVVMKKTHPNIDDRLKIVERFQKENSTNNTKTNEERFKLYAKK